MVCRVSHNVRCSVFSQHSVSASVLWTVTLVRMLDTVKSKRYSLFC